MSKHKSKEIKINRNIFEKILMFFIITISLTLFLTQIGLVSNQFRPFLTDLEVFEGHFISEIDSFIKKGNISIQLINMNADKDIKILVNGIVVSQFDQNTKEIIVKDKSVVEIDASDIKSKAKFKVLSKSDNIMSNIEGIEIETNSNIKIVCRIKMS